MRRAVKSSDSLPRLTPWTWLKNLCQRVSWLQKAPAKTSYGSTPKAKRLVLLGTCKALCIGAIPPRRAIGALNVVAPAVPESMPESKAIDPGASTKSELTCHPTSRVPPQRTSQSKSYGSDLPQKPNKHEQKTVVAVWPKAIQLTGYRGPGVLVPLHWGLDVQRDAHPNVCHPEASCRFKLPESSLAAMVLRSLLKFADECLDDPLRSRAMSLLSCFSCEKEVIQMPDSLRLTGVVDTMSFPQIDLAPLWFTPKMGLHQDDRARILDIKFQEMDLCSCTLWLRGFGPVFARPCLIDVVLRPSGLDHSFDIASDCMGCFLTSGGTLEPNTG